jgi:DNA-binding FadR family transcriptional regulator
MQNSAQSLRSSVTSELRRRIIEGDCALGARLSENVLALELGVSRTPVREALMALQDEGLVEVRRKAMPHDSPADWATSSPMPTPRNGVASCATANSSTGCSTRA